jgi:hypothetical protein
VGDYRPQVHSHHQLNRDNLPPSLFILGDQRRRQPAVEQQKDIKVNFYKKSSFSQPVD